MGRGDRLAAQLEGGAEADSEADAFWARMLENVQAMAQTGFQRSYAPRNRQMAENLTWMAEEEPPEQKIIVWIATSHGICNLSWIEPIEDGPTPASSPWETSSGSGSTAASTRSASRPTAGRSARTTGRIRSRSRWRRRAEAASKTCWAPSRTTPRSST